MPRYSFQCFEIGANTSRVCYEYNTGIWPETRPDYFFFNIGKTEVYCENIYGTSFGWIGAITGRTLLPGESVTLSMLGKLYLVTGQKVYNRGDRRALVHIANSNGYSYYCPSDEIPMKIDINNVAKKLVAFGVGKIPYIGSDLALLINIFWPETKKSAWNEVKEQVINLVDSKTKDAIRGILGGDLRYMKERITVLKLRLDDPNSKDTNRNYINIAEDLIGFEKKFSFAKEDNPDYININFFLIPLYSAIVNLKLFFYQFGIKNQSKIKLTNDDIYNVKSYLSRLIEEKTDGAIAYINKVFEDQFNYEYDHCNPDDIYNALAVVYQYCAIGGTEFFKFWREIVKDPFSTKKPYISVISYSTHFSRPTPYLSRQIVPDEIQPPLQPKLVDGKRNRINRLDVWMYRNNEGTPKIKGIRIFYENGENSQSGEWAESMITIHFQGSYLKSLTAWGNESVNGLEFEFLDGRKQTCGTNYKLSEKLQKFELEYHHIAGILITTDSYFLAGQACNIAVSYQLTPES
ncbi:unnamed protein product [Psylliodes chrysocephalus]|uniref:Uncharacterized protein n=1 Tax=Psylliodes chrysocephalus TaxID=3402493 RepID=A0A9P0G8X2_9CUCU|nr:unnamed protein product [Psylliodes chrysocephala]